jgi:hypothetical protein
VLIIPSSWGSQLGDHLHAINDVKKCNPYDVKKFDLYDIKKLDHVVITTFNLCVIKTFDPCIIKIFEGYFLRLPWSRRFRQVPDTL